MGDETTQNTNTPPSTPAPGTAPTPPETQTVQPVDISKLGDEEFEKVFDDPRLWKHSRFKDLTVKAKKAEEIEAAQRKAEEDRLKEEGKYKELTARLERERDEAKEQAKASSINAKIQAAAMKLGAVDPEVVQSLIDRSVIKVNESGAIEGVDEAVKALLESKPYLKGTGSAAPTVGSGTNPGEAGGNGPKKFKHSQIRDPEFYRANEKDILEAMKLGLIEDDLN